MLNVHMDQGENDLEGKTQVNGNLKRLPTTERLKYSLFYITENG